MPRIKKDILIQPGFPAVFWLGGRRGHKGITLAHPHRRYRKSPLFGEYRDSIELWLTQEGTLVFLWSAENDIQVLLDQCTRYDLPPISFVSYDVQAIFAHEFPSVGNKTPSLTKAATSFGIETDQIVLHRPDEDAYLTMLVLKAIVTKTGKDVLELIRDCPACRYESIPQYQPIAKARDEKMAKRRKKAQLKAELNQLLTKAIPGEVSLEKRFAISAEMKKNYETTMEPIKRWIGRGYYLSPNLNVKYLISYSKGEAKLLRETLGTDKLKVVLRKEFERISKSVR